MKEIERPININNRDNGLTKQARGRYSMGVPQFSRGRDIFMSEPGGVEINTNMESSKTIEKSPVFQSPLTGSRESIQNPILKQYVVGIEQKMQQKPISTWNVEELKSIYSGTNRLVSKLGATATFGEKEGNSADAQPLNQLVMSELERRGVNLKELFLENQAQFEKEGLKKGGVGAPGPSGKEGDNPGKKYSDPKIEAIYNRVEDAKNEAEKNQSSVNPEFVASQINEIRDLLEKGSVNSDQAELLKTTLFDMLVKKDKGYDDYRSWMQKIHKLAEEAANEKDPRRASGIEQERKDLTMKLLRQMSPYANSLESDLIREILKDEKALKYLVNRIVAQPLDSEQSEYRLSFYGGINLDQIKDILKTKAGMGGTEGQKAENNYKNILFTSDSAQLFHGMNLQIITGNLEQFVNEARRITPEQLQIMQSIPGVVQTMRLFDAEILRVLNRDGIINNKNYDEIMGLNRDDETGKIEWKLDGGTVEQKLHSIKNNKIVGDLNDLEDWELKWAFNVGKIMGNLSLRTAEQISLSKVPVGDSQYASIPQESAARLMNWLGWTGLRFKMAEARGGILLSKIASKLLQRDRGFQGFGENKIKKIGWQDLENFELSGIFGVTGIWSSWRQNLILLDNAPTGKIPKEKGVSGFKTIGDYLRDVSKFKSGNLDKDGKPELLDRDDFILRLPLKGKALNKFLQEKSAERLRETFLINDELNSTIFNNSLGLILKHSSINGSEKDLPVLRKAKEEIRMAIWRRVAEDNPLAIFPYLRGTTFEDDTVISLLDGELVIGKTAKEIRTLETEIWEGSKDKKQEKKGLVDKLTMLHEMRMQKLMKGEYISLSDLMKSKEAQSLKLDEREEGMLKNIRKGGVITSDKIEILLKTMRENNLTENMLDQEQKEIFEMTKKNVFRDLANVRFPNNPFMNDVVFEKANYSNAGAEFYRRRAGGDLSSFFSAGSEFSKLMMNPGGTPPEEAFKILHAVVEAIGSPLGTDTGQDKTAQFLEAYLTFISKGASGSVEKDGKIKDDQISNIMRWVEKDNLISGVKKRMRNPTSLAQELAGVDAPSVDEFGMQKLLDLLLKIGVTRKQILDKDGIVVTTDLDKRMRKKVKAGLLNILLAYLRDISKVVVVGAAGELIQKTTKGDK
jgi:hypothetical protein